MMTKSWLWVTQIAVKNYLKEECVMKAIWKNVSWETFTFMNKISWDLQTEI